MQVHYPVAIAAAAIIVSTASHPAAAQQVMQRRNIVFILSDDHRYDFVGFHPQAPRWLETPALDRMSREGAWMQNAFVSTALCSPSRASILAGQYAHRHGGAGNQRPVPAGRRV